MKDNNQIQVNSTNKIDNQEVQLKSSKEFEIRFSEVDAMRIVWHGAYAHYFEDAREQFGDDYGLSYWDFFQNGYYVPLVDLRFSYKKPLQFRQKARIDITYRNVPAAKIIFDYEIRLLSDDSLIATGTSTQVFLDANYQLIWSNPPFYEDWKKKHNLL
ncbi:MAG: acyl-CoA thioesterase [Tannerella sp.]|jgi:acyl-CoA thioester hydrolase|nr:acyl-CoA thioesterase [Tannerella sp.]